MATRTPRPTLTVQLMRATARIAELEATLATARQCYRDLRASHATAVPAAHVAPITTTTPIVTRFTKRDGSVWEKVRTGNRATSRCVSMPSTQPSAEELAAHHADQDAQYAAYHN